MIRTMFIFPMEISKGIDHLRALGCFLFLDNSIVKIYTLSCFLWLYQSICQAQNNSQSTVIHCTPARMATRLITNFTEYTSKRSDI